MAVEEREVRSGEEPARSTAPPSAVVELAGVSKTYPQSTVPAVVELDLAIGGAEFFSLLGPSGSGKTTTLRMIAGFERPTQGRILLDRVDVTRVPPFRRDVSTVFQNYALFPHMTVERNVAYPLRMRKVPRPEIRTRVAEMLERVAMGGYERRLPHQLSGGQRQRVALARALISRPKVLLLDEPLGALDLKLRQQMQLVLKQLQREVGITFLYVTHDQGEALAMSDRLAVMHEGRVHQVGPPREVYCRPASSFVAGFIGKANLLDCEIEYEDGIASARTGELRFTLAGLPPHGRSIVSIRHEAISVGRHGGANQLEGVVREVLYLGDALEVAVDVRGVTLIAKMGPDAIADAVPGARIRLSFDPESAVVVGE